MNYCYEVKPKGAYKVLRNCPKCGCKMNYINTGNFRVNANGDRLDVWLIYQCEKCKNTYNLSIYERIKKGSIDKIEYEAFLSNNKELALKYGINKSLFEINQAEINLKEVKYVLLKEESDVCENEILVSNPHNIKVRSDKLLSEILDIPRSKISKLIKNKEIEEIKRDNNELLFLIK